MACSPSGSTESWRDRIMGRWKRGEGREPAVPRGWRTSRSVWSAASLLALSGHPPRPKAGAGSTHSNRFARFGCGFAADDEIPRLRDYGTTGLRDHQTTGLKAQSARQKAQGAGRGGPSRLSSSLFHLPFELECDLLMQTREAGSAKRRDEFGTIRRCGEETPESGSVRSGMFGAWRWLGKRAALNGAWEGGRGEGTTGPGAPSAKRRAHGAYRLALTALRLALGPGCSPGFGSEV